MCYADLILDVSMCPVACNTDLFLENMVTLWKNVVKKKLKTNLWTYWTVCKYIFVEPLVNLSLLFQF